MRTFFAALILFFAGCGYKPMGDYTPKLLGECVYVKVHGNLRDPRNTIYINNAVREAVLERFGSRLCDRERASSRIDVRIKDIRFTPMEYDTYGYAVYYRTTTTLEFVYQKDGQTKKMITGGFYDFAVERNSVITDTLRFEAIKEGAKKAIDHFLARLFYEGAA